MARQVRKILAVSVETGERKELASLYDCAIFLQTGLSNVAQALNRNGICRGWKLYDSPDTLRARISDLERQLAELEA